MGMSSRPSSDDSGARSNAGSLVEILPAVSFKKDGLSETPEWAKDAKSKILSFRHLSMDELYKESKSRHFRLPRRDDVEEAGYSHSWLFRAPIIDAPKMLTVSGIAVC